MTGPNSPRLDCPTPTTTGPQHATPDRSETAVGARKVVAEGVPSALRPDSHAVTVTGIMPGLQIRFMHPPVADWLCSCGHHERARGRAAVIELTTRVHVGVCPHRTAPAQEGRAAA